MYNHCFPIIIISLRLHSQNFLTETPFSWPTSHASFGILKGILWTNFLFNVNRPRNYNTIDKSKQKKKSCKLTSFSVLIYGQFKILWCHVNATYVEGYQKAIKSLQSMFTLTQSRNGKDTKCSKWLIFTSILVQL